MSRRRISRRRTTGGAGKGAGGGAGAGARAGGGAGAVGGAGRCAGECSEGGAGDGACSLFKVLTLHCTQTHLTLLQKNLGRSAFTQVMKNLYK